MNEHLSLSQRIHNADGSQQVENLKAIHAYSHGRNWPIEEWGYIWDTSDETSWAHGFGRWRGYYKIWQNSVAKWDIPTFSNYIKAYEIWPEIGGMDPRALNFAAVHNLSSDVIEVAEDGKSARGAYLTPGTIFEQLKPSGKRRCIYMWERYGADFICDEKGRWKYLHEHVCPDMQGSMDDSNWSLDALEMAMNPKPFGFPGMEPPAGDSAPDAAPPDVPHGPRNVDDPGPLHVEYDFFLTPQDTCPWPEPYKTLDNDNTYTISKTNFGRE